MINKSYQIKVYGIDGTFKTTINPSQIMDNLKFSANINGGQGQLTVSIAIPFADVTYGLTDIVKVMCFDKNNLNGRLIYTGSISKIQRNFTIGGESVDLICIGLYSLLNTMFFKQTTYVFTKNQSPDQTIKDVIDYFNSQYTGPLFSYSAGNVLPYGSDINIEFNNTKCNIAIYDVQKATSDFFFYIDQNGDVTYKTNTFSILDHKFTIGKEVETLDVNESVENVFNKLMLKRGSSGTDSGPYTDAGSIALYGTRENIETVVNIQDVLSADNYGNKSILNTKDGSKEVVLTINSNYDIESIRPGQYISIYNTDFQMKNLQIQKINYTPEKIQIYLDKYTTFAQSVLSNK